MPWNASNKDFAPLFLQSVRYADVNIAARFPLTYANAHWAATLVVIKSTVAFMMAVVPGWRPPLAVRISAAPVSPSRPTESDLLC